MIIRIPCYFHTDESESLESADIEYDLNEKCQIREVTFVKIDNFYYGNDGYLRIESGGNIKVSPCSEEDLTELLLEEEDIDEKIRIITYSPQAN